MKLMVLCCLVVAVVAAPPGGNPESAQILKYESDNDGTGVFKYAFEQSDGTKHSAQGDLINEGKEDAAVAIKGEFSFIIDGVTYTVKYTADQDGYKPAIEQGPGGAVPPAIVASILG